VREGRCGNGFCFSSQNGEFHEFDSPFSKNSVKIKEYGL
jgi:hypothetical protein